MSRAAHKLLGALDDLGSSVSGRALDAGSSTGGFTQVLLERGCTRGDRDRRRHRPARARAAARSTGPELERTNLRDLELEHVDHQPVDLVVADVSFISLTLLIERFTAVVTPTGRMLLMIKPQFEVGREQLGRGGVVREPAQHRQAVDRVVADGPPLRLAPAGDGAEPAARPRRQPGVLRARSPASRRVRGPTAELNMLSQVTRTVAVLTHMGRPAAIDAATRLVEGLSAAGIVAALPVDDLGQLDPRLAHRGEASCPSRSTRHTASS